MLHLLRPFRSKLHFRKRTVLVSLLLLVLIVAFPVATYAYFARDPERLMNRNNTGISLFDRNGKLFYAYGHNPRQDSVKLTQVSDTLEHALIASEDTEFYRHSGYSMKGMARALYGNILNKDMTRYGGSTITQQLVKNTLLSSNKNLFRKYQELSLAIAVDRHYSKNQILEMYLNSVYFGEGAFGVGPAAQAYFNKSPAQLNLAEASMLVGLLPAPSLYSPISGDARLAKQEQIRVLNRMVEAGYITAAEKQAAQAQKLTYADAAVTTHKNAPHFAEMVIEELTRRYGEERITRSGFQVTTSLDLDWQKAAEEQVHKRVSDIARYGGTNAGVVAIDPKNGEVRALVGSANWEDPNFGKVNMALAARQPGSSFKPVYFAEALEKRLITPATILHDSPKTFGSYKPENYDFKFMGNLPARRALAQSRNLTAIEVMEKLGVREASAAAQRMGLSSVNQPDKYGLTLALGTAEVRPLDITNVYAAFANGGDQYQPTTVLTIKDKFDKNIFRYKKRAHRVLSPEASFLMNSILSDPEARAPEFSKLTIPNRQVAVKTGTTNDNRDAWTIGYTPGIAIGVWVGNNENKPMSGVAGSSGAGPIWRGTMEYILHASTPEQFVQPPNIEKVAICSSTGYRALKAGNNTKDEYFIKGTTPEQTCNEPPRRIENKPQNPNKTNPAPAEEKKETQPDKKQNNSGEQPPAGGRGGGGGNEEDPTNPTEPTNPPPQEPPTTDPPSEQPPPDPPPPSQQ